MENWIDLYTHKYITLTRVYCESTPRIVYKFSSSLPSKKKEEKCKKFIMRENKKHTWKLHFRQSVNRIKRKKNRFLSLRWSHREEEKIRLLEVQGQLRKYFAVGKFLSLILQREGARRKRKCFIVADPFVHVRTKTKNFSSSFFSLKSNFRKTFLSTKKKHRAKKILARFTKGNMAKVLLLIHNFFYLQTHSHEMRWYAMASGLSFETIGKEFFHNITIDFRLLSEGIILSEHCNGIVFTFQRTKGIFWFHKIQRKLKEMKKFK